MGTKLVQKIRDRIEEMAGGSKELQAQNDFARGYYSAMLDILAIIDEITT